MVTPLCPTPVATRTFRLSVARFPVQRVPSPPSPPDSLAWIAPRNTGERVAASSQVKVSLPLPDSTRSAERLVGVLVVVEVEPALERLSGSDARDGNRSDPGQVQLICDDSNIFKWTALIKGPSETPYEGGVFQLAFAIPEQYPLLPPQVRFLTKTFHPNVHFKTGEICLDILKNAWSPAWTLQSVCNLLRSGDIRGYQSMARMYTRLAAMPKKG
uniref:UBC core domain-containing protein n=1 Tax=Zea mays TaxID=4577 RepID=A0A804NTP3_MAIZE